MTVDFLVDTTVQGIVWLLIGLFFSVIAMFMIECVVEVALWIRLRLTGVQVEAKMLELYIHHRPRVIRGGYVYGQRKNRRPLREVLPPLKRLSYFRLLYVYDVGERALQALQPGIFLSEKAWGHMEVRQTVNAIYLRNHPHIVRLAEGSYTRIIMILSMVFPLVFSWMWFYPYLLI
ncbi:MAG: hypothetical protein AAF787_15415, partial [Chloroflexota bacterium]